MKEGSLKGNILKSPISKIGKRAETGKDWTRSERTERPHQGHFFKLLLSFHSRNFHFNNVLHYRKCTVLKVFSENIFSHYSSCLINKASLDSDTQYFIYFYLSVLQKYQKLIQYFQKTEVKHHGLGNSMTVCYIKIVKLIYYLSKEEFLTHYNSLHSHHLVNSPSKILP